MTGDKVQVWFDSDDDLDENAERIEPEWVKKRRRILGEGVATGLTSGKLTKVKPSKHKDGIRFKISRVKHNIKNIENFSIKKVSFDADGEYLCILRKNRNTLDLYKLDRFKDKLLIKDLVIKIAVNKYKITNFTFSNKDGSIFIINNYKSLYKYDISTRNVVCISSIVLPSGEIGFQEVYVPNVNSDYYVVTCRNSGGFLLCNFKSNILVHYMKMNSKCTGIGFHSNAIISCDSDANIYEWDIKTGSCTNRFKDVHSVNITSSHVYNEYLITGSITGFLNLYPIIKTDNRLVLNNVKSFGNLTTEINNVIGTEVFIIYTSPHKRNAIRIIHKPTLNVIENWPNNKINLGRITTIDFSKNTLAVANKNGKLHLFNILD